MLYGRVIRISGVNSMVGSRYMSVSKSYVYDHSKPNWSRVGLAFGTSAFIWAMLFKQHIMDLHEYKARNPSE